MGWFVSVPDGRKKMTLEEGGRMNGKHQPFQNELEVSNLCFSFLAAEQASNGSLCASPMCFFDIAQHNRHEH